MASNKNPKCACENCNNIGVYPFPIRRRGGGNAFLCEWHINNLHGYSFENPVWSGTEKAHGFTVSHELETMRPSRLARCELLVEQYFPTSDSTVDVEFKSPIYRGFNSIAAYASTVEYLKKTENITIDYNCGTHTHIGHNLINSVSMAYIRRFYHSLFLPLYTAWANDTEKGIQLFGRPAGGWACYLNNASQNETEHAIAINVQHEETIEFRQPRFQSAEQYIAVLHYLKKTMTAIIETFIPAIINANLAYINSNGELVAVGNISEKRVDYYYNEGVRTLTAEQRTILKKAADKTAKKLVKIWNATDVSNLHWYGDIGGAFGENTRYF